MVIVTGYFCVFFLSFVCFSNPLSNPIRPIPNVLLLSCQVKFKNKVKLIQAELSSARLLSTAGLTVPHGKSQLGFKRRALAVPNWNA